MQLMFPFLVSGSFCLFDGKGWDFVTGEEDWCGQSVTRLSLPVCCRQVLSNNETHLCVVIAKPHSPFPSYLPTPVINPRHTDLKTQSPPWQWLWRVFEKCLLRGVASYLMLSGKRRNGKTSQRPRWNQAQIINSEIFMIDVKNNNFVGTEEQIVFI